MTDSIQLVRSSSKFIANPLKFAIERGWNTSDLAGGALQCSQRLQQRREGMLLVTHRLSANWTRLIFSVEISKPLCDLQAIALHVELALVLGGGVTKLLHFTQ